MKRQTKRRAAALFLALWLALAQALTGCGADHAAATMHLVKTQGTVAVDDDHGKQVQPVENLGLFSGYTLATQLQSYGWISLDDTKLAKMDAQSEVEVRKKDKLLELDVHTGSVFFDVSQPLAADEEMNIRTSAMMVGIRGTCGWVEVPDENAMRVWLVRGKVECSVLDADGAPLATQTITAGQSAEMTLVDGVPAITTASFDAQSVPAFVTPEVAPEDLAQLAPVTPPDEPEEPDEPEDEEETQPQGLLDDYLGSYRPYENFQTNYGGGDSLRDVTLAADGTVSGGGNSWMTIASDGQLPQSVTAQPDGTILISYTEDEYYILYPAGVGDPGYAGIVDQDQVNLKYFFFDGGVMEIVYYKVS